MVVYEVVDAVAPGAAPSVGIEQGVDGDISIEPAIECDGLTINDQRPVWMIRYDPVIAKAYCSWPAAPHHRAELGLVRSLFDKLRRIVFDLVRQGHRELSYITMIGRA